MELASSNAKLDQVLNEKLELEKQMKEMSTVNADLEQQVCEKVVECVVFDSMCSFSRTLSSISDISWKRCLTNSKR
jgi:hypothetical protein